MITIIWALHPLHVSTVAYIVQRMTMLAAFFSLLSILLYILARQIQKNNNSHAILLYFFSMLSLILGIFCKENAILTIFILALIEIVIFRPYSIPTIQKLQKKIISFGLILLGIVAIAYGPGIIEYWSQETLRIREYTLEERAYTQIRVIWMYIKWFFIPNIQEFGLFHDDIVLSSSAFSPVTTFIGAISLLGIMTSAILLRKKSPLITLALDGS